MLLTVSFVRLPQPERAFMQGHYNAALAGLKVTVNERLRRIQKNDCHCERSDTSDSD
jgi:hypothetical protein